MKKRLWLILLIIIFTYTPATALASDGTSFDYDGYTYDWWWNAMESPAAFGLEFVIDESNMEGMKVQGFNDVCTAEDGRIFLVDTLENRVQIVDQKGVLLKSIKAIKDSDNKMVIDESTGEQLILKAPEGAFYHDEKDELYIADTGAGRVLVLDGTDYTMKRMIKRPENMEGVTEFKPSKITVDSSDRIYIVVQSSYEGIIELNPDGSFSRYFGVNPPTVNLIEYFWKAISTDKQKEQMKKTFAPAFNNVALDDEGFAYAVTYDAASQFMVFRFNSGGENILLEEGNTFVVGDLYTNRVSQFVDIAVTDYGVYAVLDRSMGRIFLYDNNGQLLNVFGSLGETKGAFRMPSGIAWLGNKLVVTDSALKRAYVYGPSDFGSAALNASEKYYLGKWDDALALNEQILKMNANYEIAYIGIGKSYLMKEEYKKAMYYFKLGNNRTYYSKAFNGYRGEVLKDNFGIVMIIFLLLITLIVVSEVRYHRKGGSHYEA